MKKYTFLVLSLVGVFADQGANGFKPRTLEYLTSFEGRVNQNARVEYYISAIQGAFKIEPTSDAMRAVVEADLNIMKRGQPDAQLYKIILEDLVDRDRDDQLFIYAGKAQPPRLVVQNMTGYYDFVEIRRDLLDGLKRYEALQEGTKERIEGDIGGGFEDAMEPDVRDRLAGWAILQALTKVADRLAAFDGYVRADALIKERDTIAEMRKEEDLEVIFKRLEEEEEPFDAVIAQIHADVTRGTVKIKALNNYGAEAVDRGEEFTRVQGWEGPVVGEFKLL